MAASKKLSGATLKRRLAAVRLLSVDVDGVLTDGGLYFDEAGRQLRKFNVKDGLGLKRAMQAGIEVALVTAANAQAIRHRANDLGIRHLVMGSEDKIGAIRKLGRELGIDLAAAAHIGDDANDLPVFATVGLAVTVADASTEAKARAHLIIPVNGGNGAVRALCDLLVAAKS